MGLTMGLATEYFTCYRTPAAASLHLNRHPVFRVHSRTILGKRSAGVNHSNKPYQH